MISSTILLALLPLLASAAPLSGRQATGQYLKTSGNLCLVASANEVGAAVLKVDCTTMSAGSGLWNFVKGGNNPNGIQVSGTNLCLDAGSSPANNTPLKVWTCYPGLTQQTFYYTDDARIAITGGSQCLDSGPTAFANAQIQTYQCTPGNTNQIFNPASAITPTPTVTSTVVTTTSVATSTPITTTPTTTTGVPTPEATDAVHITFNGTEQCLTVMNGYAAQGTSVNLAACSQSRGNSYDGFQRWFVAKGVSSTIRLAGTDYCLDSSSFPGVSGTQLKIWTCSAGNPNQQWYYTADNHIAVTGGTQCVDVVAGSTPINAKPYGSTQSLQTWTCGSDVQQVFTTDVGLNL